MRNRHDPWFRDAAQRVHEAEQAFLDGLLDEDVRRNWRAIYTPAPQFAFAEAIERMIAEMNTSLRGALSRSGIAGFVVRAEAGQ